MSNNIKIAFVKSSVYQDLWVCDISNDFNEIFRTSLMRCPAIGLAEHFNTDFIIIKDTDEYPCNLNKNCLSYLRYDNMKYSKKNKYPDLPFLDETYHEHISIDSVAYNADDIDWNKYNIVIAMNNCISNKIINKYNKILWCYYNGENEEHILNNLIKNYDISLNQDINKQNLPDHSIEFPYTFLGPNTIEKINLNIPSNKEGIYMEINNTTERPVKNIPFEFLEISKTCNIPIIIHDQNIVENCKKLYNSKYFIKLLGRVLRGNSLLEAISAGVLILANKNLVTYNDLIHDNCHITNYQEVIEKINYYDNNKDEYDKVIEFQRNILFERYFSNPINNLYKKYYEKMQTI
jgi:hypothetical protein